MSRENESLTLLGNQNTTYDTQYNPSVLERFGNKPSVAKTFGGRLRRRYR